ncbi:Ubiquitin fusion degradation protein 4 [Geranomyces michiganensis]|nr:Ubiquitin fusion degradation protein 4 [Geranomyces michiganensis]
MSSDHVEQAEISCAQDAANPSQPSFGTKKRTRNVSIAGPSSQTEATSEPPVKRQRQAAVKALEGISSIAKTGRRLSNPPAPIAKKAKVAAASKSSMGKGKGKGKVDSSEAEEATHQRGQKKKTSAGASAGSAKPRGRQAKKQEPPPNLAGTSSAMDTTSSSERSKRGRHESTKASGTQPEPSSSTSTGTTAADAHRAYSEDDEDLDDFGHDDDEDVRDAIAFEKMMMSRSSGLPFSLGGMLGGTRPAGAVSGKFTEMLRQIKAKDDPTMQMVALQELSEILSMATEDMFIGHGAQRMVSFSTDEFVKALVELLNGPEPGSGDGFNDIPLEMLQEMGMTAAELGYGGGGGAPNPELMLLACRCLSNLIEAHPSSTMHVLQHGAVQVLVGKLMEVEYIDLAEQVLAVLDKISVDYPSAIIRANGLLAALQYIDFFGLHVQRTAVTIVANACQGLGVLNIGSRRYEAALAMTGGSTDADDSDVFRKVNEVIPILERLLSYQDTKLVDQAVRALDRIVDWSWKSQDKLESLITPSLLQTVVGIINLSGSTAVGGAMPPVFTKLVKLLVNVAKGSPKLATSLLVEHQIVQMIKNYLTGGLEIRQPADGAEETDMETISAAVTTVVVTRSPEQVLEVVKLASAVLPTLPTTGIWHIPSRKSPPTRKASSAAEKGEASDDKLRDDSSSFEPTSTEVLVADGEEQTLASPSQQSPLKASPTSRSTASKEEVASSAGERHLDLLKAHPEAVRTYSTLLLPIFIEVFGVTVNANLRRAVVECVAKGIWYIDDAEFLTRALAKNRVFGKFVPELLGLREIALKPVAGLDKERREALVLVTAGVQIAFVVMDRCGERFKTWFAREGAMEEMRKIVAMEDKDGAVSTSKAAEKALASRTQEVSELVKDLKRVRDQMAGHIGSSSGAGPPSANERRVQMEHLLKTVEALRRSTAQKSQAAEAAAALEGSSGSMENMETELTDDSEAPKESLTSSRPKSEDALLSTMRSFMDRLAGSDDDASSTPLPSTSGNVTALNGSSCSEQDVHDWIVSQCQAILDATPSAISADHVLDILRDLVAQLDKDADAPLDVLHKIAFHFAGTGAADGGISVTGFEMLGSGILTALATYLTSPGARDVPAQSPDSDRLKYTSNVTARLKAFLHVFLNGPSPDQKNRAFYVSGAFKRLVQTLQESLSRVERFQVAAAVPSSSTTRPQSAYSFMYGSSGTSAAAQQRESSNPSLQLTRQLKLKLMAADPATTPKSFQALTIGVHAVATYKALEDYLKSRVGTMPGMEPARSENKNTGAEDVPASDVGGAAGAASTDASPGAAGNGAEEAAGTGQHASEQAGNDFDHDEGDEMDDDDPYGDDDDDMDENILNVSDLLLNTEEASRSQRRRQSQPSTPPEGNADKMGDGTALRRDSVIDVRNESSNRPSVSAPSATPATSPTTPASKATARTTAPSKSSTPCSYASVAKAATPDFDIEFTIADVTVPKHSTIFASLFKHASEAGGVPDVWATTYTVTWRKVPKGEGDGAAADKQRMTSDEKPISAYPMAGKLPFSTVIPEGISLEGADGQVLNLLRILHGLNTRWAEVYATEEAVVDDGELFQGGSTALKLQEGSQPVERVAVTSRTDAPVRLEVLPPAAFSNTKLTAKLNRQLDEPLIVASDVLPNWCAALAKHFSFLVPFETRLVYLQSTSFGYSRSMGRWQQQQNQAAQNSGAGGAGSHSESGAQHLGRIQRQKVRIARNRILDSMIKVMELYGSTQALLEVEFFDEVGTGLGPTLEFYSTVCRDIRTRGGVTVGPGTKRIKIWRDDDGAVDSALDLNPQQAHLNPPLGFFPAPMRSGDEQSEEGKRALSLFQALGTFVAKALLDSRLIDLPFSPIFLEMVVGEEEEKESALEHAVGPCGRSAAEFHLVRHIDPALYKALLDLKKYSAGTPSLSGARIEDLYLDFTLPGYPHIELCEGGKDKAVDASNVRSYVERVVDLTVGAGVAKQVRAFRAGFDAVFPATDLASFSVQELAVLVGGTGEDAEGTWSPQTLRDAIRADHGFNADSPTVQHLITYMSQLTPFQRREFLQFVTGSPKLPIGGFANLSPPLTVVRKTVESDNSSPGKSGSGGNGKGAGVSGGSNTHDYLPSVMTCANYLKVPEYRDVETLKARFDLAVREGQGCFHLS